MATAIVQKQPSGTAMTASDGVTSINTTFGTLPSVNNIVVAVARADREAGADNPPFAFSDNQGNTWTMEKDQLSTTSASRVFIGSTLVETSSGSFTVTLGTATNTHDMSIALFEISGAPTSGFVGPSNSGTGPSSPMTSGAVNPSGNAIYIAMAFWIGGATRTLTWSGATEEYFSANYISVASLISSGSQTATWTQGGDNTWTAVIGSYNEDAGGISIPVLRTVQSNLRW